MKAMWASERMHAVGTEISKDWCPDFLRYCDNCGLAWEASQENENCPLAELEVELFPCCLDDLLHHPDLGTHPIVVY